MVHRTVVKVEVSCENCKKKLLRAISGLEGIDKIEFDTAKGTLAVTGNADPYKIIVRIRKTRKLIEIVSIGPPPAPPKPDAAAAGQKKPDEKKKPEENKFGNHDQYSVHPSSWCPVCARTPIIIGYHSDPNTCSVM